MKTFSVPADFEKQSIINYSELNNCEKEIAVSETYGQLTTGYTINSGRIGKLLPQVDINQLAKYVDYSLKNGIKFNYTLNSACLGNMEFTDSGAKELIRLLKDLKNIGIKDLTITSPAIMELIKMLDLDFNIKVSAISHVDSITKLKLYKKLGIKRVVVEPDLHRDFSTLKNMAAFWGKGLEIIVNDICYKNCPYKIFHYNHEAHTNKDTQSVFNYYFMRCGIQKSENFANYLKLNWIRPEDLDLYENVGISNFKIQGRPYVKSGDIMRTLLAYSSKTYEGNLLDLLHLFAPYDSVHQPYIENKKLNGFIDAFYYGKVKCMDNCDSCGYCDDYAAQAIHESRDKLEVASRYYKSQDQYRAFVDTFRDK